MRRLRWTLVGFAGLIAVVVALGLIHHVRGARFEVTLTPRSPLTIAECQAEVHRSGGIAGQEMCPQGQGRAWYRVEVRNVGHRGAWVADCIATGRDRSGSIVPGADTFDVPIWISSAGIGARPYLEPGRSATLDWFAPVPSPIDHYTGSCSVIVYSRPPI
jgi:hypothetical protein